MFLATFQAFALATSLEAGDLASDPGLYFRAGCVITLVGGTMFLMWLGEQITSRGIGNGISLIIFVGIVAEIPAAVARFLSQGRSGAVSPAVILGVIVMVVVVLGFVVFMERSLRKIHIQYPRRQVGMKVYDSGSSHLPIKVNPAGVIPAIFASALLAAADHDLDLFGRLHRADHVDDPGLLWPRPAALPVVLRLDDRVLHLFLHP